ncbi:MAG TPA: RNA polymerase-binding protein DksA, partial [Lysobacter sp.]|nr:RNA polymerase-binding protein DksA [Lysobacter sp.]
PVAKQPQVAVKKPAAKPATKSAPVATPAPKAEVAKPAVAKSAVAAPQNESMKNAKPALATAPKPASSSEAVTSRPRPAGKVAVAVAAKPAAPAPRGKVKVVDYKTDDATGRPIVPQGYKPSNDEEYMSTLQVEYFRQRLLGWRADLVEESKQTIENLKDEVRDVGDEAERATRETENSLELRTRDRYRKLISKIDSTLKRVDSGDYGFCVDTGEEIGLERLEARLTAERTIDAQERWEHMQKQMGD